MACAPQQILKHPLFQNISFQNKQIICSTFVLKTDIHETVAYILARREMQLTSDDARSDIAAQQRSSLKNV